MSIVLKSNVDWRAGHATILPVVGKVLFSKDGTIEVQDQAIAEELISVLPEFSILSQDPPPAPPTPPALPVEPIKPQTQEEDLSKKKESDIKPQTVESQPLGSAEPAPEPVAQPAAEPAPAPVVEPAVETPAPASAVEELKSELAEDAPVQESAEEIAEDDKSANAPLLSELRSASKEELVKFAEPFPKEEWESLNKADLFAYLRKHLIEAK